MKKFFILGLLALTAPELRASEFKDIVQTCKSFKLDKASVSAVCNAENGGKYKTALRLRGVNNKNGALQLDENSSTLSVFFITCTQTSIDSRARLAGLCKDDSGDSVWSVLDLRSLLKNYNGTLVYPLD
ncbi:MAG: hypothetical protein NTV34_19515 [Proteobacteria bacterium]|nr:hypothetical protein [Pseudomonadota bacterium]